MSSYMKKMGKQMQTQNSEYYKADFSVYLPADTPDDFRKLVDAFNKAIRDFSTNEKLAAIPVSGCIIPVKIKKMPDGVREYFEEYDQNFGEVLEKLENKELQH